MIRVRKQTSGALVMSSRSHSLWMCMRTESQYSLMSFIILALSSWGSPPTLSTQEQNCFPFVESELGRKLQPRWKAVPPPVPWLYAFFTGMPTDLGSKKYQPRCFHQSICVTPLIAGNREPDLNSQDRYWLMILSSPGAVCFRAWLDPDTREAFGIWFPLWDSFGSGPSVYQVCH